MISRKYTPVGPTAAGPPAHKPRWRWGQASNVTKKKTAATTTGNTEEYAPAASARLGGWRAWFNANRLRRMGRPARLKTWVVPPHKPSLPKKGQAGSTAKQAQQRQTAGADKARQGTWSSVWCERATPAGRVPGRNRSQRQRAGRQPVRGGEGDERAVSPPAPRNARRPRNPCPLKTPAKAGSPTAWSGAQGQCPFARKRTIAAHPQRKGPRKKRARKAEQPAPKPGSKQAAGQPTALTAPRRTADDNPPRSRSNQSGSHQTCRKHSP